MRSSAAINRILLDGLVRLGVSEAPPAATLTAALGRAPSVQEVAAALFEAVRRFSDSNASPIDDAAVRDATSRRMRQFENELWTWRR